MDELKLLIEMVKDLPSLATWVLVAFFVYKVLFIGGAFSLARFVVQKVFEGLTTLTAQELSDFTGSASTNEKLLNQIYRIRGIKSDSSFTIYDKDVRWLEEAITEKMLRELEAKDSE